MKLTEKSYWEIFKSLLNFSETLILLFQLRALVMACQNSHTGVVKYLMRIWTDLNAKNENNVQFFIQ